MLNAHWLGKPLVMADRRSADGYLEDGVDALVTEAGDAVAVRAAVNRLLASQELRERLAEAGRARVRSGPRETLPTMQAIYNLALEADSRRRTGAPAGDPIALYGA
jgi:hypothetical protein